jgi:hypothetical protein
VERIDKKPAGDELDRIQAAGGLGKIQAGDGLDMTLQLHVEAIVAGEGGIAIDCSLDLNIGVVVA